MYRDADGVSLRTSRQGRVGQSTGRKPGDRSFDGDDVCVGSRLRL